MTISVKHAGQYKPAEAFVKTAGAYAVASVYAKSGSAYISVGESFTPDADYYAGRQGFALDFTDTALLFQNSNGTGAVTANSDPIGYATDLSGNAKHATSTLTARPLYNGGKAVFDGSNDILTTPAINLSGTDKVTVIAAVKRTGTGNHGLIQNAASGAGSFNAGWFSGNAGWRASLTGSSGNSQIVMSETATPVEVLTFQFDMAGAAAADESIIRKNGDPATTTVAAPGPAGGGNLLNSVMTLGQFSGFMFNGDVYRIVVISGVLTANERFLAERWCGQAIGVTVLPEIPPAGDAGVNHFFSYGQSLSVGTQSRPAISTTPTGNYTFAGTGRVRAWDSTNPYTAFQAHVENDSAAELMGETPCYGAYQLIAEQQAYTNKFLASAPGYGAVSLAELSTGGGYYTRLLADVTNGRKLSRAEGRHFKVRAYMWMQGEADEANADYAGALNTFNGQINTDIKNITKQTDDVWLLSYQLARAKIGLEHLKAQENYARIRVALPMYFLPTTDSVHLTASSSKIAGAYFGLAYKRILLDGNTAWKPLMVTSVAVAGATIDLTYNAASALAFDTTIVAAQTNQGFRLVDSGGSPLTISSVTITGANTVRIVAASAVPAGAFVQYGFASATNHVAGADKGNLRDSQGASIIFNGGGLNYPMHNWAVLQRVAL